MLDSLDLKEKGMSGLGSAGFRCRAGLLGLSLSPSPGPAYLWPGFFLPKWRWTWTQAVLVWLPSSLTPLDWREPLSHEIQLRAQAWLSSARMEKGLCINQIKRKPRNLVVDPADLWTPWSESEVAGVFPWRGGLLVQEARWQTGQNADGHCTHSCHLYFYVPLALEQWGV